MGRVGSIVVETIFGNLVVMMIVALVSGPTHMDSLLLGALRLVSLFMNS
jgi:hypothetical protein